MTKSKTARTTKEYRVKAFGYEITIPANSLVSNQTAQGHNDNYRFWIDWHDIAETLTGTKDSLLSHDLKYRGINVPAQYCELYPE